jgi:WD40 repeat protein
MRPIALGAVVVVAIGTTGCGDSSGPTPVPASVTLRPDTVELYVEETEQLTATVLDSTGAQLTGQAVTFSSSEPLIASVSLGGLVTAEGSGTATITATAGPATGTASVVVRGPASMTVSPNSVNLAVCQTQSVHVTVYDALGDVIGAPVTFTPDDSTVAKVSIYGVITGVGTGSTVVVATAFPLEDTVTVQVSGPLGVERICISGRPFGVAISAPGTMYVSQPSHDQLLRLELPSLTPIDSVDVGRNPGEVVFSADGARVYTPEILGTAVSAVDVVTNQRLPSYAIGETPFRNLPSHDGTRLYVASHTGVVHVFNTLTDTYVTAITATGGPSNGLVLSTDGTRLYASSIDGEIAEIDTGNNTVLRTWPVGGFLQDMVLAPDGTVMYVADENGPVKVLDVASGTVTGALSGTTGGFDLALSPDGSTLAVSITSGTVMTLDRTSGQITGTYAVGGTPRRIAYEASGAFFAVANESGGVDIIR